MALLGYLIIFVITTTVLPYPISSNGTQNQQLAALNGNMALNETTDKNSTLNSDIKIVEKLINDRRKKTGGNLTSIRYDILQTLEDLYRRKTAAIANTLKKNTTAVDNSTSIELPPSSFGYPKFNSLNTTDGSKNTTQVMFPSTSIKKNRSKVRSKFPRPSSIIIEWKTTTDKSMNIRSSEEPMSMNTTTQVIPPNTSIKKNRSKVRSKFPRPSSIIVEWKTTTDKNMDSSSSEGITDTLDAEKLTKSTPNPPEIPPYPFEQKDKSEDENEKLTIKRPNVALDKIKKPYVNIDRKQLTDSDNISLRSIVPQIFVDMFSRYGQDLVHDAKWLANNVFPRHIKEPLNLM